MRAFVLLFVLLFGHASSALASDIDEAYALLEARVIQLDAETDPVARTPLLDEAIEAYEVIEGFDAAGAGGSRLAKVRAALAASALSRDSLNLALVESLLPRIAATEDGVRTDLRAKAATLELRSPAYRATAWTALAARHLALGQGGEAERLAARAVADAATIEEPGMRDGALRASVLEGLPERARATVAATATAAMTTAATRSGLYHALARSTLAVHGEIPDDDRLVRLSADALENGDLLAAMRAAQAISRDDGRRNGLLEEAAASATIASDDPLALELIKSMSGDKAQDAALLALVDHYVGMERPLRARPLLALLLSDARRADGAVSVARALRGLGYDRAARELLEAEVAFTDDGGKARIAAELAAAAAFDSARATLALIQDPDARAFALSRIAKRAGERGLVDEARADIALLTDADQLAFARSGLGRGLARKGDVVGAEEVLRALVADEDRDRVLSAIAEAHIRARDVARAESVVERLRTDEARSRVLLALANASLGTDRRGALARALEASATIKALNEAETRDALLAEVAIVLDRLGEASRAIDTVAAITDETARERARAAVANRRTAVGDRDGARALLPSLEDPRRRSDVLARLAEADYSRSEDMDQLLADLGAVHYTDRVRTLRSVATRAARALDTSNWLGGEALRSTRSTPPEGFVAADFRMSDRIVSAPAAVLDMAADIEAPPIFGESAARMRAETPAPHDGIASLSILGFSPYALEAFKLTRSGAPSVYRVQVAQNLSWPFYIAIESGTVSLSDVVRALPQEPGLEFLEVEGDTITIRAPLIVLPGATLLLSGAEYGTYRISATTGAFVTVAGRLIIQDADLVGWDEALDQPAAATDEDRAEFRPFITAWSGSRLDIAGSRLAMLGYDYGKAYGLTQSSGASVQTFYGGGTTPPTGAIVDNSFENLRYGYYSYEAEHVTLIGNEYRDSIVYGIDPHDRSRHLVIALNTSYGAAKKHGIIVSREVDDSFILGNLSVRNNGSGFMLDRTSVRNVIYANTAWGNGGDGLTFYESGCNVAASNSLRGNARAGVKVRNSTDVLLIDNDISKNGGPGADVYIADLRTSPEGQARNFVMDPYTQDTSVALGGNSLDANPLGINVDGASRVILDRNRFANHGARLFGGDLRSLSSYLLQIGDTSPLQVDRPSGQGGSAWSDLPAQETGDGDGEGVARVVLVNADDSGASEATPKATAPFGASCTVIEERAPIAQAGGAQ